jgi:hypothetical protein
VARVAAAVKTGDDQEVVGFDKEEERVGKSLRTGSTEGGISVKTPTFFPVSI